MTSLPDMRRLRSSPLLRNILAVASGAAAGQAVTFAFSPLITRIYSPEVFGLQGVFISLVSILSPVIALRYPMAIVIARDNNEVAQISHLSLIIAAFLASLLGLGLALFGSALLEMLGAEHLGNLIWLLPLALFFVALQDVANYRASRLAAFRLVGAVTVIVALLFNLSRLVGGLIEPTAAMLVGLVTIVPLTHFFMLKFGMRKMAPDVSAQQGMKLSLVREHRDFPLFRVPTDVLNGFSQTAPVFLLAMLFSPATVGFYGIARTVVSIPLSVVGGAIGTVYYSRLAEMNRMGLPLFPLVLRGTIAQFLVPGGGLLLVSIFFPTLFAFVFGETWRPSGEYAQWMALWVVGMLANIPVVRALPVIGAQWIHLTFNILILLGSIFGLVLGYWMLGSAIGAIAGYSIASASLYAAQILTYLGVVARHDRK